MDSFDSFQSERAVERFAARSRPSFAVPFAAKNIEESEPKDVPGLLHRS